MTSIALSSPVSRAPRTRNSSHSRTCHHCGEDELPRLTSRTRFQLHFVTALLWAAVLAGASLWLPQERGASLGYPGTPQAELSVVASQVQPGDR